MKKNDSKKYYDYLLKLGYALFSYYNAEQLLSQEQIELIANSSNGDIIEAMEYLSLNNRLKMFCMNTASINRVKRKRIGKID